MFPSLTDEYVEDSDSSFSELSSDSGDSKGKGKAKEVKGKVVMRGESEEDEDEGEDEDEDIEWEDVFKTTTEPTSATSALPFSEKAGDLQLVLGNNRVEIPTNKKGSPSQERRTRAVTHCLHVQFLLFHGAVRNGWLCDSELHAILLSHLTPSIMKDVEKFQARQGKKTDKETVVKGVTDPILKILGTLIHWWKKKFTVDKYGMRKTGYKTLCQLQKEKEEGGEKFWFTTGNKNQDGKETYTSFKSQGERVEDLKGFRKLAKECKGSRDTGAMLFTALLRAIGLETTMIFSLQPLGFGFTERENFTVRSPKKEKTKESPQKASSKGNRRKSKASITSDEGGEDGEDYGSDTSGGFLHEESASNLPRKPKKPTYDNDLPYPIFWSEVYSSTSNKWITVESLVLTVLGSSPDLIAKFEPKGKRATDSKQVIAYVMAYSSNGAAKDITVKYLAKNTFPGKTKGVRIPITKIPFYDYEGEIVTMHQRDWFGRVMRGYRMPEHLRTERERKEDDELQGFISKQPEKVKEQRESISYYKNSSDYVLERHLKREEAVKPGKSHVKTFIVGKGDKVKEEKVYSKDDIAICKTVESWYREGKVIREGEQPLKRVRSRAATLNRKREIEEAKKDGETIMQGLYSEDQTILYNPPPIVDGRVPRNSFGNIDIYVPSMIPSGAIHLPLKGSAKLARRLGIDHAEALTGFEFKKQRAVPIIEGIIIAEGNGGLLRDAWRIGEEEKKKRADGKREKAALAMWRRFLVGLRIVTRLRDEYGDSDDSIVDINPFAVKNLHQISGDHFYEKGDGAGEGEDEAEMSGGFLRGDGDHEVEGGFARDYGNRTNEDGDSFIAEEAINNGGNFQIIPDDEDKSSTMREGSFFVPSADSLQQNGTMSLREMMAQKEKQISKGDTEFDSKQEMDLSAASPPIRSTYFMNKTVSNNTRGSKKPVISSEHGNELSELPSEAGVEGVEPHQKTRIEVQIPITQATPGRKPRTPKVKEASAPISTPDIRTPSTRTRRVSKRKAAVGAERDRSKHFIEGIEEGVEGVEVQRWKSRKISRK